MAGVVSFMESPLVTWVESFNEVGERLDFHDVSDSVFLNDVLLQIDQRSGDDGDTIERTAKDSNARLQNWSILLSNIHNFYQDFLQQTIVMETPNVLSIVREPTKECSLKSLEKVLLLLLGCAIQCHKKEVYINQIKTLPLKTQEKIVHLIQQITEHTDYVVSSDLCVDGTDDVRNLYNVIQALTAERHRYSQKILQVSQECDYFKCELASKRGSLSPPTGFEQYHLQQQLTQARNSLNTLTEDNEEKCKVISDLREESDALKAKLLKFKTENLSLTQDAKLVREYRDEVDAYKEKVLTCQDLEKQLTKAKEKLNELDFFKSRVEELREESSILSDSKQMLEDQGSANKRRNDAIMDDLVQAQLLIEELNNEKETTQKRLTEVMDENASMQFECSKLKEGCGSSSKMRKMMSYPSSDSLMGSNLGIHLTGNPISDELKDTMNVTVTQLEMEKDELQHELDDTKRRLTDSQRELDVVKRNAEKEIQKKIGEILDMHPSHSHKEMPQDIKLDQKVTEAKEEYEAMKKQLHEDHKRKSNNLQKEKSDLLNKLEYVQDQWKKEKDNYRTLEMLNRDLKTEKDQFKITIETIRQNSESCIRKLEHQVEVLQSKASNVEHHNTKISNLCDSDVNKDNASYLFAEMEQQQRESIMRLQANAHSPSTRSYSSSQYESKSDASRNVPSRQNSRPSSVHSFPAQVVYVEGPVQRTSTPISQDKSGKKSSKTPKDLFRSSSCHSQDAMRINNGVSRPTSAQSMSGSNRTPLKNIHQQQRLNQSMDNAPFVRGDKLRSTVIGRSRPQSVSSGPFSRKDPKRMTMPEKRSIFLQAKPGSSSKQNSSNHHIINKETYHVPKAYMSHHGVATSSAVTPTKMYHNDQQHYDASCTKVHSQSMDAELYLGTDYGSDRDSGNATSSSPECVDGHKSGTNNGDFTDAHQALAESMRSNLRMSLAGNGKISEKWRGFIDKIVELQDKNQQLILDNSDMRKKLNAFKFSEERIRHVEAKNLELELENKKLHKIVESLQGQLTGKTPYDPREYHFYTNV